MASTSWITVELTGNVSQLSLTGTIEIHEPDNAFARASYNIRCYQMPSSWKDDGTHAFRGSKEAILLISTPERCCLEKTRSQFSCDEYHKRCCGSSRGPEGRAICEYFPAIASLKGWVRPNSSIDEAKR